MSLFPMILTEQKWIKKRKATTDETVQRSDREDYDCIMIKIGSFSYDDHNWDHF